MWLPDHFGNIGFAFGLKDPSEVTRQFPFASRWLPPMSPIVPSALTPATRLMWAPSGYWLLAQMIASPGWGTYPELMSCQPVTPTQFGTYLGLLFLMSAGTWAPAWPQAQVTKSPHHSSPLQLV